MSEQVKSIVIVGGGTAGWLTAGTLAASLKRKYQQTNPAISITLIESSDIQPIGVGEGTWPTMRQTLSKMGIKESDFIRHCNVSLKQGSTFNGWRTGQTDDSYLHPFSLPANFPQINMMEYWLTHPEPEFANLVTAQTAVCHKGLAPKQSTTPDYAAVCNYGYHLDAGAFSQFIKQHCIKELGVKHIVDTVKQVESHPNQDIKGLHTSKHGLLAGDLFIDCSGMQGLLINQHYKVKYQDKTSQLFNNSALACHLPYQSPYSPIASTTISTAKKAGWVWDIGLQTRRGIGLVYSNQHLDDDGAKQCLRNYMQQQGSFLPDIEIRKLSFTPGYREKFWQNNCIAIGLSAGFVEPLEASSLALVELSADMLASQFPHNKQAMPLLAKRFNQTFSYRWQRVIDFLKLHYYLSQRDDHNYWREHKQAVTCSDELLELLELWKYQAPWHYDFNQTEVFPSASYQYILSAMDYPKHPQPLSLSQGISNKIQQTIQQVNQQKQQYLAPLPTNRELLDKMTQRQN
ncbi:tryptophan halogenase family protein [Paraglaciecola sp.]|uniref:tryptophan halogenase family protein n=1 Tax=Paraglaciecola sp. TaxID=1920173 RepID=UPI003EF880F1